MAGSKLDQADFGPTQDAQGLDLGDVPFVRSRGPNRTKVAKY